jgi:hypothetical protein
VGGDRIVEKLAEISSCGGTNGRWPGRTPEPYAALPDDVAGVLFEELEPDPEDPEEEEEEELFESDEEAAEDDSLLAGDEEDSPDEADDSLFAPEAAAPEPFRESVR